ncbi:MAG: acylphosphatase [Spirochaetes bacterium]|nr:acylphosphatase [Spirochaetota bacterium]
MSKKIILRGMVQGVCCRQYCSQYGRHLSIRGAASNCSDGSVRVLLDTDNADSAKQYIASLINNPRGFSFYGSINDVELYEYSGPIHGDYLF